jgi:hypothetical protein
MLAHLVVSLMLAFLFSGGGGAGRLLRDGVFDSTAIINKERLASSFLTTRHSGHSSVLTAIRRSCFSVRSMGDRS